MISFILNGRIVRTEENPAMALLEFIRDVSCLSGTKEACHEGECGACTVLVGRMDKSGRINYRACASCILPIGDVAGCHVVTVEGLSGKDLTLVQKLIVENNASQCGFCTPGIVMSLTGFCFASERFSYEEALNALDGNLCRCTGYVSIRMAARALCDKLAELNTSKGRTEALIEAGIVPEYFSRIPALMKELEERPQNNSENAVLVAGGTDLFVQKPQQLMESELCFVSHRPELNYIREEAGLLIAGAAVTIEDFRLSPAVKKYFPSLEKDFLLHSSAILRNKATLAGNIANASPIGDATIILMALDACLTVSGKSGKKRNVKLENFYLGYKKTDLACGEMITEIAIPLPDLNSFYNFEKVSNRKILDIAAVNSAMRLILDKSGKISNFRVSVGGAAPVPLLLRGLEKFYGRKPDESLSAELGDTAMAQISPISDIRGSSEYKKLLTGKLMSAHIKRFSEVK